MASSCRPAGCHLEYDDHHPPGSEGELEQTCVGQIQSQVPGPAQHKGPDLARMQRLLWKEHLHVQGHYRHSEDPGNSV